MIPLAPPHRRPPLTRVVGALLGGSLVLAARGARSWHTKHDQMQALYHIEQAKHSIPRQSLDTALASIATQNAAIEGMVTESNARLKAGTDALAAAQKARSATESAAQGLRASAGRVVSRDGPCVA